MLLLRQTILPMYFFIDKYRYECSFHWQIQVSRYCLSKDLRMGVVIAFWWRSQLLRKDAIETVPMNQIQAGFYSTFFLVPKKNGKMRPVLNLRPLNRYLQKNHFKMDTMSKVLNLVKPKDWAISLDLTEAYLHISLFPKHRKYLRFCIAGQCFQWKCLCFGPTSAPRVFTKIVAVVAAHLRAQNIHLASYLDDWLAVNQICRWLLQDREKCLNLLMSLGFISQS